MDPRPGNAAGSSDSSSGRDQHSGAKGKAIKDGKMSSSGSDLNATVKGLSLPEGSSKTGGKAAATGSQEAADGGTFVTQGGATGAAAAAGRSLGIDLNKDFDSAGGKQECAHYRNLIWRQKFEFLDEMVLAEQ